MGLREDIDALLDKYGDRAVFDAFLDTWEPLEMVRDAIVSRINKGGEKKLDNKVRYSRRQLILMSDNYTCWACDGTHPPDYLEVRNFEEGRVSFEHCVTTCKKCKQRIIKTKRVPDFGMVARHRIQVLGGDYYEAKLQFEKEGKVDSGFMERLSGEVQPGGGGAGLSRDA